MTLTARALSAALILCAGASLAAPIGVDPITPMDARLGSALAPAGDFDRDGFPDVVMGASNYDGEGAVFILKGATGLTMSQRLDFPAEQGSAFGSSVAGGCDLNGDGAVDVVVGAPEANLGDGKVVVFFGGQNPPQRKIILGSDPGGRFGAAVACVPDVDGDRFDDLVVGAPNSSTGAGVVYVFPGSLSGPQERTPLFFRGGGPGERVGTSVASAGDTNGDGRTELLVGAPGFAGRGRVMVLRKDEFGPLSRAGFANDELSPAFSILSGFGASVAALGDVDDDGKLDVAVGAPEFEGTRGAVFVYSLSNDNLELRGVHKGPTVTARLGASVSGPGDVNGDGFADLLAGATGYQPAGSADKGAAFVYLGGPGGLRDEPLVRQAAGIGLAAEFGSAVSGAGDVDGDGFADVVIGAPLAGLGSTGEVHVFQGLARGPSEEFSTLDTQRPAPAVAAVGDVNGDGFEDFAAGTPGGGSNPGGVVVAWGHGNPEMTSFAFTSTASPDSSSRFGACVAAAGDVNGDGFADVLVGAPPSAPATESIAWLFLGTADGLGPQPWSFKSRAPGDRLGDAVAGLGDVNGDGYDDVAIGAPAANGTGAVYGFFGGPQGPGSSPDWIMNGPEIGAFFGTAIAAAGDADLDGFADFAVGAPGADSIILYYGRGLGLAPHRERRLSPPSSITGLGGTLSGGGDVNGDGVPDLVALATPPQTNQRGTVVAVTWLGARDLATTPSPLATSVPSQMMMTLPAVRVAMAGDADGDGRADVLVGHPELAGGLTRYLRGKPTGDFEVTNWTPPPNHNAERQGASVSGGGDLNGDGFPELLVGAPGSSQVRVYLGGDGEAGRVLQLAQLIEGEPKGQGYRAAPGDKVGFQAMLRDEVAGLAPLRLEVEVKRVDTPFDGQGTFSEESSTSQVVTVDFTPPGPGRYHWRARVVSGDRAGHWRVFGGSDETRTDFSWGLLEGTPPGDGGTMTPVGGGAGGGAGSGGGGGGDSGVGPAFFETAACNCSGVAEGPLLLGLAAWLLSRLRRRRG
ncbi:MAG: FG-GAP repeat protein [Myxococcales bacterium]|nr:FG-GAP repeat protein [Myxococcales bacterium]